MFEFLFSEKILPIARHGKKLLGFYREISGFYDFTGIDWCQSFGRTEIR